MIKQNRYLRVCSYRHKYTNTLVYTGQRMMEMELPGRRIRGMTRRRSLDVVTEDMQLIGLTQENAEDRIRWK